MKKFKTGEKIYNTTVRHPRQKFYIHSGSVSYGIKQPSSSLPVYSFIDKNSDLNSFKSVSTSSFNAVNYGATITGSSITFFSSSLDRNFYTMASSPTGSKLKALKNTLNFYSSLSPHFSYSSSLGNKEKQDVTIVDVPAWFYGSSIKRGTVDLGYYKSGSLLGRLKDENKNGELIQVAPSGSANSGSVAGVCLYNEGIILLTGSWSLDSEQKQYKPDTPAFTDESRWIHYGVGVSSSQTDIQDIMYDMQFDGTVKVPTLTLFCNAEKAEFNTSHNPTFIKKGQDQTFFTSSNQYRENSELEIKNITSASYTEPEPDFEKTTYISHVYLYDDEKNLVGIAKTSRPIRKTEERDLTFKLKLDL